MHREKDYKRLLGNISVHRNVHNLNFHFTTTHATVPNKQTDIFVIKRSPRRNFFYHKSYSLLSRTVSAVPYKECLNHCSSLLLLPKIFSRFHVFLCHAYSSHLSIFSLNVCSLSFIFLTNSA